MIYLIHKDNKALKILDGKFQEISISIGSSITETLFCLAKVFPDQVIIWCNQVYVDDLNPSEIPNIFHHKQLLASYAVSNKNYIPEAIGYVDTSVFLNIKKEVCYPTWLMSSDVGGVSAEFLLSVENKINVSKSFNYFLNSLAKLAMPKGLFCYSAPKLFKNNVKPRFETKQASNYELFKFVKQHYKWVWIILLFINKLIHEKQLLLVPFLKSVFCKQLFFRVKLNNVQSVINVVENKEVDVIIPTIGREKYLYDLLKDLSNQTIKPKNVIIVEQNPVEGSVTALNYLELEAWDFNIIHKFIHKNGACNARNIALNSLEHEWCFLADDDIRLESDFIEKTFIAIDKYGVNAMSLLCLQLNETTSFKEVHQTGIFGSGNSFVKKDVLANIRFNIALEHGYGEDFDFGVQLRNLGTDIVYFPDIRIEHLKAPIGGFRAKVVHPWDVDIINPKPSPTIMYTYLKHCKKKQVLGYKLILFFKLLKKEPIYNYIRFYNEFQKKWQASKAWANRLS